MKYQSRAAVFCFFLLIEAALIFVPRLQSAQTPVYVYNSFGPGNTYVNYAYWGVHGASLPGGFVGHAESFVPTLSGNLGTLQVAIVQVSGGDGLANFFVAADNGGTPGIMLESFMNVVAPASGSSSFLVTMNSITQPLLQGGTTYWLCLEPADDTTAIGWFANSQGYVGEYAQESPPGAWAAAPVTFGANGVFDVSVTPVPEPALAGLLFLAVSCLSSLSVLSISVHDRKFGLFRRVTSKLFSPRIA